jgi:predicted RNase H-like HicB family nuclease
LPDIKTVSGGFETRPSMAGKQGMGDGHCPPYLNYGGTCCFPVLIYSYVSYEENQPMKAIKIIIERHPDGYVAYPLKLKGVVVGQGDTYEAAMSDVRSAINFHIETFGSEVLEIDPPILEAFVAETAVEIV